MDFNLFSYCTVGRRAELENGLAGQSNELYQRMLDELATYATAADQWGYAGWGHPEHHLQVEGFEASNELGPMAMWLGSHSQRMKIISCGWVSTTHNPLRSAEYISTLDHMLKGRFSFGMVRGYQYRWVENFKIQPQLAAVGPWNKDSAEDDLNREYFSEYVDVVLTALQNPLFRHEGKFFQFPATGMKNPHQHDVYTKYGAGVREDMTIDQVGIAPRPFQDPMPQLYGGFSASLRTAMFWARHKGRPIVLSGDLEFCRMLWAKYKEEAERWGHDIREGEQAAWGGLMICAPTDELAHEWAEDMLWFWDNWAVSFGQPRPKLLIGSPDTISRMIEEAQSRFAVEDNFLIIPQGIFEPERLLTSLELFATKVMPRFQG